MRGLRIRVSQTPFFLRIYVNKRKKEFALCTSRIREVVKAKIFERENAPRTMKFVKEQYLQNGFIFQQLRGKRNWGSCLLA